MHSVPKVGSEKLVRKRRNNYRATTIVFPPDSRPSQSCNAVCLYFKQQINLTLWNHEGKGFCKYSKLSLKFPLTLSPMSTQPQAQFSHKNLPHRALLWRLLHRQYLPDFLRTAHLPASLYLHSCSSDLRNQPVGCNQLFGWISRLTEFLTSQNESISVFGNRTLIQYISHLPLSYFQLSEPWSWWVTIMPTFVLGVTF